MVLGLAAATAATRASWYGGSDRSGRSEPSDEVVATTTMAIWFWAAIWAASVALEPSLYTRGTTLGGAGCGGHVPLTRPVWLERPELSGFSQQAPLAADLPAGGVAHEPPATHARVAIQAASVTCQRNSASRVAAVTSISGRRFTAHARRQDHFAQTIAMSEGVELVARGEIEQWRSGVDGSV
jgi:hypothetical protein